MVNPSGSGSGGGGGWVGREGRPCRRVAAGQPAAGRTGTDAARRDRVVD
ncbi:hypothetical protein [Micromonospora sp. NPDC092111]